MKLLSRFLLALALAVSAPIGASLAQTNPNAAGGGSHIPGPRGPIGPQGAVGPQGPQGVPGTNGAQWYSGTGVPSSGIGANGDVYERLDNGAFYNKVSGAWSASPITALGIGTLSPSQALDVVGNIHASGNIVAGGGLTVTGAITYGGITLPSSVTGTGSMVLSTAPTFAGPVNIVSSGALGFKSTVLDTELGALISGASKGVRIVPSSSGTAIEGVDSTGVSSFQPLTLNGSALTLNPPTTFNSAITYGGVTLATSVVGTGSMVLNTSPTLVTPVLGIAAGTSLALGGATIGTDSFSVTGTSTFTGAITTTSTATFGNQVEVGGRVAFGGAAAGDVVTYSGGRLGFTSSTNPTVAPDTAFSRLSAGVMGLGTGAAGSTAGSLQLASLTSSGQTSLTQVSETYVAPAITSGTLTIDLSQGTVFNVSSNANISTFTISNAPASRSSAFTLVLTANGTAYTQAWGTPVKWAGGTAPTVTTTTGKADIYTFVTNNGGTTWYAFVGGQSF